MRLCRSETLRKVVETLRSIIEDINVRPLGRGAFEMELTGEIVNMIDLTNVGIGKGKTASEGAAVPDAYRSSVKVVAGARNQRYLHLNYVAL